MQLPHPSLTRARDLFNRLYRNNRLDVKESQQLLEAQLDLYLDHLKEHLDHAVSHRDRSRIWSIIERNINVGKVLESPAYHAVVDRKKALKGPTHLGFVFCIDGRIPAIFLGGRFARHYEIPAAEVNVIRRKSDGKIIPDSTDLNEGLRRLASDEEDLLEIVLAHTSLLDPHHGCGAMAAKKRAGQVSADADLEEANLKIIKDKTIPALTNIYNEYRGLNGLEPLETVGISGLYDTDTFGIILNYDLRATGQSLSTTELTKKYKEPFDDYFIKSNLVFGSFKEKFSQLKYFVTFSENILKISEDIIKGQVGTDLLKELSDYLGQYFPHLTTSQTQALRFVLIRNIAFQYLTGLASVKKRTLDHPFAEHGESYMSIAMRGAAIGKFDPESQVFSSTPADPPEAVDNINTMMSIMGTSTKITPYILFVCNSVNSRDLHENNKIIQRLMGSNAGLVRDIIADKKLGPMIEKGEIILIPVLVEEDSRQILKIVDHSAYI